MPNKSELVAVSVAQVFSGVNSRKPTSRQAIKKALKGLIEKGFLVQDKQSFKALPQLKKHLDGSSKVAEKAKLAKAKAAEKAKAQKAKLAEKAKLKKEKARAAAKLKAAAKKSAKKTVKKASAKKPTAVKKSAAKPAAAKKVVKVAKTVKTKKAPAKK